MSHKYKMSKVKGMPFPFTKDELDKTSRWCFKLTIFRKEANKWKPFTVFTVRAMQLTELINSVEPLRKLYTAREFKIDTIYKGTRVNGIWSFYEAYSDKYKIEGHFYKTCITQD